MEWDTILTLFADQNQGGGLSSGIRGGIIGGSVAGILVAIMSMRKKAAKKKGDPGDDLPTARRVRRPDRD